MKLIYISGPYTGKDHNEVELNIQKASKAGRRIIEIYDNYYPVIPHNNTAHFEDYTYSKDIGYEFWLYGAIELLKCCEAIYMLRDWKDSPGAVREYKEAVKLGLEIYYE